MPGLVVFSSSNPVKHSHYHHCFFCKKYVYETNVICKKEFDHDYPCMNHIEHYRTQLGMFDCLIDDINGQLTQQEAARFEGEWQQTSK